MKDIMEQLLFIFACYALSAHAAIGPLSTRSSCEFKKPHISTIKHRSADTRTRAESTLSTENDQEFIVAKSLNSCIGERLAKISAISAQSVATSSTMHIPLLPLCSLENRTKLLTQAYRAMALFDTAKKRYPTEEESICEQANQTVIYIKQLDPSANMSQDIPESARGSSGRRRLWIKATTAEPSTSASHAASSSQPTKKPKKHKRKTKKRRTHVKAASSADIITVPDLLDSLERADSVCDATDKLLLVPNEVLAPNKQHSSNKSFFSSKNKNSKGLLSLSAPELHINSEAVQKSITNYMCALSLYVACYNKKEDPIKAYYIRTRIDHVLRQLHSLFAPKELSSSDLEPEHAKIIASAQEINRDAIIFANMLEKNKQLPDDIAQGRDKQDICRTFYHHMAALIHLHNNQRDEASQLMCYAHAKLTWELLKKLPECKYKQAIINRIFLQWQAIAGQPHRLQAFFEQPMCDMEKKAIIFSTPLAQSNDDFRIKLIDTECRTLEQLRILHAAYQDNIFKQYTLIDGAQAIINTARQRLRNTQTHEKFTQLCALLAIHCIDFEGILRFTDVAVQSAMRTTELKHQKFDQSISQIALDILPTLIDVVQKKYINPSYLPDVIKQLRNILNLLMHKKCKDLINPDILRLIKTTSHVINQESDTYTLKYYVEQADKLHLQDLQEAKKWYLNAVHETMLNPDEINKSHPAIVHHICALIPSLWAANLHFSQEELSGLIAFANYFELPIATCLQARYEAYLAVPHIKQCVKQADRLYAANDLYEAKKQCFVAIDNIMRDLYYWKTCLPKLCDQLCTIVSSIWATRKELFTQKELLALMPFANHFKLSIARELELRCEARSFARFLRNKCRSNQSTDLLSGLIFAHDNTPSCSTDV